MYSELDKEEMINDALNDDFFVELDFDKDDCQYLLKFIGADLI